MVSGMENLCNMLFEFSNEDRLRIMQQLTKKAMNVTNLSKTLGLTIQECSRHTSRLSDVGLTKKDTNSLYHLTLYGELGLRQLEGLQLISKHKDYFALHSATHLPQEFVCRIGELAGSTYVGDISAAFYNVERVMRDAKEYIFAVTDHYLASSLPLHSEAFERGVKVRSIDPKAWIVPPEIKEAYRNLPKGQRHSVEKARMIGILEEGLLEHIDIFLYMSEKEVGIVGFPFSNGRFDYLGFMSTDKLTHKWCKDLFQYYWERSPSRERVAEELYTWIKKRPKAIRVLKSIAAGKEILYGKELISELEKLSLIRGGKLTISGDLVYLKLANET